MKPRTVLVWCDGDYEFGNFLNGIMKIYIGGEWVIPEPGVNVTHWQDLPEKPDS